MILGWPGLWFTDPGTGIDASAVVNLGQELILHAAVPTAGTVRSQTRIVNVFDRGAQRGALVQLERLIRDHASGQPIATVRTSLLCRNNGGFGGVAEPRRLSGATPDRVPDHRVQLPTLPQAHLLYRLNGDYHPLHADPDFARSAGFPGPILHGLATFAVASHALLKTVCHDQPERLLEIRARFSAPFLPGETLAVDIWQDGAVLNFCGWSVQRACKVLDKGHALVADSGVAVSRDRTSP
jgi:acyl dehydratase